jgi:hypothetical protein
MVKMKLLSRDFYLDLSVNQNNWCLVLLKHSNATEELGADTLEVVAKKFLLILDINFFPEPNCTLDDKLYYLFVSFFEKHSSGYARVILLGIEIHFRDASNQPLVTVFLSHQERQTWKNKLEQMFIKIPYQ